MSLDAFTQFFTNETVRDQAWEATKTAVNYGVDNYAPSAKTLLTAAAVVVGGIAVIGAAREANRRGHLHMPARGHVNPFGKRPTAETKKNAASTLVGGASSEHGDSAPASSSDVQPDEVALHTRSHDHDGERQEGADVESKRKGPRPGKSSNNSDE